MVVSRPLLEANWQLATPDTKKATMIIRAMDRIILIGTIPAFFDEVPSGLIRLYLKKLGSEICEPRPEQREQMGIQHPPVLISMLIFWHARRFNSPAIGSSPAKDLLSSIFGQNCTQQAYCLIPALMVRHPGNHLNVV